VPPRLDASPPMPYSRAVIDVRIEDQSCRERIKMSRLLQFVSGVGVVFIAFLVVMAILSVTGHFHHEFTNPPN
jgi:hypothetical protein